MFEECKFIAPDVDRLIRIYDRGFRNPEKPSDELITAIDPIFAALSNLAPMKANDEAKVIWFTVPRGTIADFGSYEDYEDEFESPEEFEEYWREKYPEDIKWYRLTIGEGTGHFKFRSLAIDNTGIINADMGDNPREGDPWRNDEPAIRLCELILPAVKQSMEMLRNGTYNQYVADNLPYWHRTGVIHRYDEWKVDPKAKEYVWENMDGNTFLAFKSFLETNSKEQIGRIKSFTANDFFNACCIGYRAIGWKLDGISPDQAYVKYSDGRDEGLTGKGMGLNKGPGIDFSDPAAWDAWFNGSRGGGHPWEVVPGGNSTHVELYVAHDNQELGYLFRSGQISEEEYHRREEVSGYYFAIAGKHRPFESVFFFVALREAGLPVYLYDSDEILARYEGTDYVGIVPHRTIPRYCEGMFPKEKYGRVIDFMHVYDDEKELLQYIEWLPEEEARLMEATE